MASDSPTDYLNNLASAARPHGEFELIAQWQAFGEVKPELLTGRALDYARKAGVTSVQSYVHWAAIEKEPGQVDFSSYDVLVEKLPQHSLKWVPFCILGPYYATPRWFRDSDKSIFARCLEHGRDSGIQSIWNPHLPEQVERFWGLLAEHYLPMEILESITLGPSGDWGEALYPVRGGFIEEGRSLYTHPGWWCGDPYALVDFRQSIQVQYGDDLARLNRAWGTSFRGFEDVAFPPLSQPSGSAGMKRVAPHSWYTRLKESLIWLPPGVKEWGRQLAQRRGWNWHQGWYELWDGEFPFRGADGEFRPEMQRWLDFVGWYTGAMTKWAEFWIKTARSHFPQTPIYLTTGGVGNPIVGADLAAQTKMAARYDAGIRITNHGDDYQVSFIITRLVAAAARIYKGYFTTEEAIYNQPRGVTMRLFDAVTSGARGVYCKSFIGTDLGPCSAGYYIPLGEPGEGAVILAKNLHYLDLHTPRIETAVLVPNTTLVLDPAMLAEIYRHSIFLREHLDLDLVDEQMVQDGVLQNYRLLLVLQGRFIQARTAAALKEWVAAGGFLISLLNSLRVIGRGPEGLDANLPLGPGTPWAGRGEVRVITPGKEAKVIAGILQTIKEFQVRHPESLLSWLDYRRDAVFATRFAKDLLFFNANGKKVSKRLHLGGVEKTIILEPYGMGSLEL